MKTTKEKILDNALELFSEKGYTAVSMRDIADKVGIKAPSLYKHYANKQAIFDAILNKINERYKSQANALSMSAESVEKDAEYYADISENKLIENTLKMFKFLLHDEYESKCRKLMTIEQFKNNEIKEKYMSRFFDDMINYHEIMFKKLIEMGVVKNLNPKIMALQDVTPIYTLLLVCDRQPERENEALELIGDHIKQFNKLYRLK